jgi:GTP-binding protein HflX
MDDLLQTVKERLYESYKEITAALPYDEGALIALFHEEGLVNRVENKYGEVIIQGRIPERHLIKYRPYLVSPQNDRSENTE